VLLPSDLEPRAFLGEDAISFSELSTLARCEAAWKFGYGNTEREKSNPSAAMKLGSEVHRLWGAWWTGGDFSTADGDRDTGDEKAQWLMERYRDRYFEETLDRLTMLEVEKPLVAKHVSWFFGFADGLLVDENGEMWIAELKTTDSLSKVTSLLQSAQMPLYVWAARQMGYPVVGSMLDVIRTFKPVRKELPLEESFDRRWIRTSDEDIDGALAQLTRAWWTRRDIRNGEAPLRNVGPACSWCFACAPCFQLDVALEEDTEF